MLGQLVRAISWRDRVTFLKSVARWGGRCCMEMICRYRVRQPGSSGLILVCLVPGKVSVNDEFHTGNND